MVPSSKGKHPMLVFNKYTYCYQVFRERRALVLLQANLGQVQVSTEMRQGCPGHTHRGLWTTQPRTAALSRH